MQKERKKEREEEEEEMEMQLKPTQAAPDPGRRVTQVAARPRPLRDLDHGLAQVAARPKQPLFFFFDEHIFSRVAVAVVFVVFFCCCHCGFLCFLFRCKSSLIDSISK